MATYKEIQAYVQQHYGFQPKTCWIAHVKEMEGLPLRRAWNRHGDKREEPCPPKKVEIIKAAFRHFKILPTNKARARLAKAEAEAREKVAKPAWKIIVDIVQTWQRRSPGEEVSQPSPKVQSSGRAVAYDRSSTRHEVFRLREDSRQYSASAHVNWLLSLSAEFQKSISRLDKKLQGRILEALSDLSSAPTVSRGDTKKPLVGELKGKWRYRIGDYRIVYMPDETAHTVLLLAVFPRGAAYVD